MTEGPAIPRGCESTTELRRVRPRSRRRLWLVLPFIVASGVLLGYAWSRTFGPERGYLRGRAALINGDREIVLLESERLVRIPGYEPQGWLLKGLWLTQVGKLDEAIVYLGKAAEHDALSVEANTAAAQCLYQSGLYLQAINAAQVALQRDATALDARRWLAAAYYDLGAVSHAVTELERISAEAPHDARPSRLLGLIAKDGEDFSRAIDYYSESLKRDPAQPELGTMLSEMAECQLRLNQFEAALATLKDCERSAAVLTLQADCLSSLGRVDDAHARLNYALKLDAGYFPAKLAQGKLHLDQGRTADAARLLSEAVQLNPQISQAHFHLSQALRRLGKEEQADEELLRRQEVQALERAFSDVHVAAANQPDDAEIRCRAGELALRLGKHKLAHVWFRAALAIDPKHPRARAAINGSVVSPATQ